MRGCLVGLAFFVLLACGVSFLYHHSNASNPNHEVPTFTVVHDGAVVHERIEHLSPEEVDKTIYSGVIKHVYQPNTNTCVVLVTADNEDVGVITGCRAEYQPGKNLYYRRMGVLNGRTRSYVDFALLDQDAQALLQNGYHQSSK